MRRRVVTLWCFTVALVGHAAPAQAQEIEPIRLTYRAGPGCPSEQEFVHALRSRAPAVTFALDGPVRAFSVALTQAGPGVVRGSIEVVATDGAITRRHLEAATCHQLFSAAVFVTALAIDPRSAQLAEVPAPSQPKVAAERPKLPPGRPARPWSLGVFAQWGILLGPTPKGFMVGGGGLAVEQEMHGWFRPGASFSLLNGFPGDWSQEGATADFDWISGSLSLCGVGLHRPRLDIEACASFEVGRVVATGGGVDFPERQSLTWFAPGAMVRGAWGFTTSLFLAWQANAGLPLRRATFYFQRPDIEVYQVPALAVGTGLALGVNFL